MSGYSIALFLHILGAVGLFATLALDWAATLNLRRAATVGQVREWGKVLAALGRLGGPSALITLVTGIFLMAANWGMRPWIALGFAGMAIIAIMGGALTGRKAGAILRTVPQEDGAIPTPLRHLIDDPMLLRTVWLRTTLGVGIVFLMSTKPGWIGSLTTFAVSLIAGWALGTARGAAASRPVATEVADGAEG